MSWRQLQSIYAEGAAPAAAERAARPTACPRDGQPLQEGPDGFLFCDWDGWNERDNPTG